MECLTLRVKDVDIERGEFRVRRGKGARDRVTVLADVLSGALASQIEDVRRMHERDCGLGMDSGWVSLPDALSRKYPQAGRSLQWQSLFPARRQHVEAATRRAAAAASSFARVGSAARDD